ncbi:mannose-6-phosphate isomerase, class I [Celerinatantimonas diazotrophica]|uniref:mannose-6-phosphate isomerase n=1 Tax=Celerinatantimonas diazotrophica TaxID=412034 RepID=A0A4R1K0Z3_9GAMM|nr:mannose-6-phosphate isomerase, class I [Celerinatantimonas diazotrophica]TCK57624.1 mannose-6-phosphate isomerase type 1 [Celerinatantimonas diazotrophica]CAG9298314.1 Mannose-6-phosphate isomerase [Celerinatantimonas diazotrophica]
MTKSQTQYFYRMQNPMQHYAWGTTEVLNSLFGIANPDGQPQAEIWMGAHINGCSLVHETKTDQMIKLSDLLERNPELYLGKRVHRKFNQLPFLFKVLSAAQALSIQVHPSLEQARQGYAKENEAGIDIKAPNRNYKDPNHKPELVFALTPYQAMNGFRPIPTIIQLFEKVNVSALATLLNTLKENQNEQGLAQFFTGVVGLNGADKHHALEELLGYTRTHQDDPLCELIDELAQHYPDDTGLFAPLMLNVITLQPGDAMFLYACTPHAYLKGTGLEIMANSDNVIRAGLSPKHVDIPELLSCCEFISKDPEQLLIQPHQHGDSDIYHIPVDDFRFAVYQDCDERLSCDSAEIIFAIDANVQLTHSDGEIVTIHKGESVFIPAHTASYRLMTPGQVARAYC